MNTLGEIKNEIIRLQSNLTDLRLKVKRLEAKIDVAITVDIDDINYIKINGDRYKVDKKMVGSSFGHDSPNNVWLSIEKD